MALSLSGDDEEYESESEQVHAFTLYYRRHFKNVHLV